MLNDELDMLKVRLAEYEDLDVRHVIVEAPVTHRGDPKPLHYADNASRFARWADRITHVIADDLPSGNISPWAREHAQRDSALGTLAAADPDDRVLIADVDEIVPAAALALTPPVCFETALNMYAADWLYGPAASCVLMRAGGITTLSAARDARMSYPQVPAGHHLTWLGGPEAMRRKADLTCHLETPAWFRERLLTGSAYYDGLHPNGTRMLPVDVDDTYPKRIQERNCPEEWFRPR